MSEPEQCPKCESKLSPRLSSGRIVCVKCGWSDRPSTPTPEKESKSTAENSTAFQAIVNPEKIANFVLPERKWLILTARNQHRLGSFFFIAGIIMMITGLFYDTSVSTGSSTFSVERVVNTGKVSERETFSNIGGFLSICGSIFLCTASINRND